jgi:hypothetical protein
MYAMWAIQVMDVGFMGISPCLQFSPILADIGMYMIIMSVLPDINEFRTNFYLVEIVSLLGEGML